MTKEQALKILTNIRNTTKDENVKLAIDCALDDVGRCHQCSGRKERQLPEKPSGPHRVVRDTFGRVRYLVECVACESTGKYLKFKCESCGKATKVDSLQKHMNHCKLCADRLERKGAL